MSVLRTLLELGGDAGAKSLKTIYVFHSSYDTTRDGNAGCCCLWTAPSDTLWAAFEVWGGGGDGGGVCCCMQGFSGGSGSYGRKMLETKPSQPFTLCSAGMGCCRPTNTGCPGCGSYACSSTGCCDGTYFCICASGGGYGRSDCHFGAASGTYCGCPTYICGCVHGADFAICGFHGGGAGTSMCASSTFQLTQNAPMAQSGARMSHDNCYQTHGRVHAGPAVFPGGGGGTGDNHDGGCRCGGPGAGGLVVVYYQSDV